jgi:hypothetical protein
MSAGNNQINFVAGNDCSGGTGLTFGAGGGGDSTLSGTFGAFLWQGFQSGVRLRPDDPPTNQFFM